MADAQYKDFPFIFNSRGIVARKVDDATDPHEFANMDNLEELAEAALSVRLGSLIVNSQGSIGQGVYPLTASTSLVGTPTAAANQGSFPGGPWTTPANMFTTGLAYATCVANNSGNTPTDQLLASVVTPQIPAGAIIRGFSVSMKGIQTNPFGIANYLSVQLALSGTGVGVAKTIVMTNVPQPYPLYTVGSSGDLWGYGGWTTAGIIANFGIILQAVAGSSASTQHFVNSLTVTFYYDVPSVVHSLAKLSGLSGAAWRYAGVGSSLYRRTGLNQGAYTRLSTSLSGSPWWACSYRPDLSSYPTMFFADAAGMLKDNGSYATPQQSGIFQPQYPVLAQAQDPSLVVLDNYTSSAGTYTYTGIGGGSNVGYVSTSFTGSSSVAAPGIQEVDVLNPEQIGLFQYLTISSGANQETVLVIFVTATGFVANFTKPHPPSSPVTSAALSITVPASTVATVGVSFASLPVGAKPIPANWPVTGQPLQQADYIGFYIKVSDPTQVQSIQLAFDCGDGSFQSDYFYKVIAQGPLQSLLSTALNNTTAATTAATDALLNESLGLYGNSSGSIAELQTGKDNWTPLLIQLSDFAGAGRADFSDPVFNWPNVNGYQVTVTMNDGSSATIEFSALICFGGAGPDSLGGVAYDWVFTFYNDNDGTESNPSMFMTNVNPPNDTNWIVPRRQPVLLTANLATNGPLGPLQDGQITAIRIYRRGGTLGDNFRRVFELPVSIAGGGNVQYLDTTSDADLESADILSLTNDVPVTSGLVTPVNTLLNAAIATENQVVSVFPVTMANISVRQQVSLGSPTALANNFETVIVLTIASDHFTAFVQNTHLLGENVQATAFIGQPVTEMALAFNQFWYAGDPNNPHLLYWSKGSNPQAVGAASNIEVGSPDDPITAIVPFKGNLYVSTRKFWWSIAPGSNANGSPTVYPTAAKHGCMATHGWFATEEAIYYQAIDGLRAFAGGASDYLTQDLEFIFQGVGTTPIVEADQTQFASTVAQYWNNMGFFSYIGLDGNRHRLVGHQIYKRWRNDDVDAQSLLLEADTNTLVFGDSNGLVHEDRQDLGYDEANVNGLLAKGPIAINLQTFYQNNGLPDITKSYQELTLDINTAGQTLNVFLLFEDGQVSQTIGTVNTTIRQKVNFNLNAGAGFEYYKVALKITGSVTQQFYIYQCSIKALPLAKTRKSLDTFWLRLGEDGDKIAKDSFWEVTSTQDITVNVYYDGSSTVYFPFTLKSTGGIRRLQRQRLPAVAFRMIRFIATSTADFQVWGDETCIETKPVPTGKGYAKMPFMPN